MANRLGLGNEVRELKIGQSFTNPKSSRYHTIKYDFKPSSVIDTNKLATVDVGNSHQVTVTVPNIDGAGAPQTVFQGSQRPYQKECVLVIDRKTGEITLEKLSSNIQVKKTRNEPAKLQLPHEKLSQNNDKASLSSRSLTPPIVGQRISNRTKVTSGSRRPDRPITQLVQRHSPLQASPSYPPSGHQKSPKNSSNNTEYNNPSALASLPLIDDYVEPFHNQNNHINHNQNHNNHNNHGNPNNHSNHNNHNNHNNHILPQITVTEKSPVQRHIDTENHVGEMSNSSSSSSSDSDSDSDMDATMVDSTPVKTNGNANGTQNSSFNRMPMATHLLNEDLCLSESGSDSD